MPYQASFSIASSGRSTDQAPVDRRPVARRIAVTGVDDGKVERRVALLLADRRQDPDPLVAELQDGVDAVLDLDPVQSLDGDLGHLAGDGVSAIAGEAVDAGAHDEVGADLPGGAEELVDVVLAVADMDQPLRRAQERGSIAHVGQPPMLSLPSIGTRVGLTRRFRALVPLNLDRDQKRAAAKPSGRPSGVTARLACISSPQMVCSRKRPSASRRLGAMVVAPMRSGRERRCENSVVSWMTRIGPPNAATRLRVASKCPRRISASLTASLDRKRWRALVPAQS